MLEFITAILGAGFIGSLVSTYYESKLDHIKEKNLLKEKWGNLLRDSVSNYLGLCETLRSKSFVDNPDLFGKIISSLYKVELLLSGLDNDQKQLSSYIKNLKEAIVNHSFKTTTEYQEYEEKIANLTKTILQKNWNEISKALNITFLKLCKNTAKKWFCCDKHQNEC